MTLIKLGFGVCCHACNAAMKTLMLWVGWCLLFVICWPMAILALVLFPFVWLISLPLRLLGITFEAVFQLFRTIFFLPARTLEPPRNTNLDLGRPCVNSGL